MRTHSPWILLLALVAAALVLSGCPSGDGGGEEAEDTAAAADEMTGGVEPPGEADIEIIPGGMTIENNSVSTDLTANNTVPSSLFGTVKSFKLVLGPDNSVNVSSLSITDSAGSVLTISGAVNSAISWKVGNTSLTSGTDCLKMSSNLAGFLSSGDSITYGNNLSTTLSGDVKIQITVDTTSTCIG